MSKWEQYLEKHYFDPEHPGAYAGPYKLHLLLKRQGFPSSYRKVRKWLQKQDAYSLLQPVRYRFKRKTVITKGIDDLWDVDLADVSNTAKHNDDVQFLLIVIDVFSKHLWVEPLKSKHHDEVLAGFKNIFATTDRKPTLLRSDKGKEFTNRWVKAYLKKQGIYVYTTKNETKANYAERVIRTVKGLMYRYFIQNQTYRYLPVLQNLVFNYNNRPHTTLDGLAPASVNKSNEALLWKAMYMNKLKLPKTKTFRFKVGDKVRVSHLKYVFQRDYQEKWTEEVFMITHRYRQNGVHLYRLKDFADEPIDGYFYEQELQRVEKEEDDMFRIEKVIKTRKRRGLTEHFVKWMGWPAKFNSWVQDADVQRFPANV